MYTVAINFRNGNVLRFYASKFDIDIMPGMGAGDIKKYTYQDANEKETPLYLIPKEVVGIVVAPVLSGGQMSIITG